MLFCERVWQLISFVVMVGTCDPWPLDHALDTRTLAAVGVGINYSHAIAN